MPQIEELIAAFSGQNDLYTTQELLNVIDKHVLAKIETLSIVGVMGRPTQLNVAHFLYQVGFISARKDYGHGDYDHFFYAEKPFLLTSTANLDDGASWEIHIAFRLVLNLRHYQGRPTRR